MPLVLRFRAGCVVVLRVLLLSCDCGCWVLCVAGSLPPPVCLSLRRPPVCCGPFLPSVYPPPFRRAPRPSSRPSVLPSICPLIHPPPIIRPFPRSVFSSQVSTPPHLPASYFPSSSFSSIILLHCSLLERLLELFRSFVSLSFIGFFALFSRC